MGSSPAGVSTASVPPSSGLSSWSQVCWERGGMGGSPCRGISGYGSASVRVELLVSGKLGKTSVREGKHLSASKGEDKVQ
jgi:hypothetical protein